MDLVIVINTVTFICMTRKAWRGGRRGWGGDVPSLNTAITVAASFFSGDPRTAGTGGGFFVPGETGATRSVGRLYRRE